MRGELVAVTTADHVRLHGFYLPGSPFRSEGIDGVVLVHGLAGNFYGSPLLTHLAKRLVAEGVHVVIANTRGHDFLNFTVRGGRSRTIGAAVEDVSECRFDLPAWVDFLVSFGCQRVALCGHSLGAIKALYSEAHAPHDDVAAIVALSPTRLNFEQFAESRHRDKFLAAISQAEELVAANQGERLLQIEFPFPTWMAAKAYLDKYGQANHYDWFRFYERVAKPMLIAFGEIELAENAAFEGLATELSRIQFPAHVAPQDPAEAATAGPLLKSRLEIVPRADHFYVACYDRVADVAWNWFNGGGD